MFKLWAGLGYYARARNLHACAKAVVERHGGAFPATEADLAALPGIGPYTAAAVAAIAFDCPASPVDGNVERVVARLYAVEDELPAAKPTIRALAESLRPPQRPGDFAQAHDGPRRHHLHAEEPGLRAVPVPGRLRGAPPRRSRDVSAQGEKREGRLRRGAAFVALRADGHLLVRTRPARGLLGGMTEVPTTEFLADFDEAAALDAAPSLACRSRAARAAMAAPAGRGDPRVHPFPAGIAGVPGGGAGHRRQPPTACAGSRPRRSAARHFRA